MLVGLLLGDVHHFIKFMMRVITCKGYCNDVKSK